MILVHNMDSYTGSAKAASQVIENAKIDIVIYGKSNTGGFISDVLQRKKNIRSFCIGVGKAKSVISFLKIQLITFFILVRIKGYKQGIFINALLPFSAIIYSVIHNSSKSIIWVHEQRLMHPILNKISNILMIFYRKKILYCSEFLKSIHLREGRVLSPYVDDILFNNYRERTKIKNVLMLSSLSEYKGVDTFVRLSKRYSHCYSDLRFTLVLSSHQDIALRYFSRKSYDIPENLSIVYSPPSVIGLYSEADLVVNLTNRDRIIESFGLTIAEALTNGIPVLCPGIGGPKELLGMNNEYGFFIDERSLDEIQKKLDMLLLENQVYQKMSKMSYAYRYRFSKENFIINLNDLI